MTKIGSVRAEENMQEHDNALLLDTVRLSDDGENLVILDQTLLPGRVKTITLHTKEEIWEAIRKLRVRGAPAIGVTAGYAMAVLAGRSAAVREETFRRELAELGDYLKSSRPTAVNLAWAVDRMEKCAADCFAEADEGVRTDEAAAITRVKAALRREAQAIRDEDVAISRAIGEAGFALLHKGDGILTHCNAGTLATAKYGTATAPVYLALEHGWSGSDLHIYCDETRPLLQGARLTAYEMAQTGFDVTLQCDNMVSALMQSGKIRIVFVGCDRVARNGDAANKIGTSGVAILAKHYGIPFYVCAPSSTIDPAAKSGADIPIEMRDPEEVTEMWYRERMAPKDINVFNPAFDVTESGLITGIITEKGICRAPYEKDFMEKGLIPKEGSI